jgi:outer membrane protein assembly factor BamB
MATSRETRVRVGFGLTVTNKGVGTVAITPALAAYDPGSSVELRALPAAGRQLIQWSGDVTSSANPLTLTVNGHLTVVAEFSFLPGDMIWAFATGGEVRSTPAIGTDGTVYVGSGDKKVYALDGATGTLKWSFAMDWQITSSAALGADGTVYIASYALDGVTGRKLLAFESVGSPFGSSRRWERTARSTPGPSSTGWSML